MKLTRREMLLSTACLAAAGGWALIAGREKDKAGKPAEPEDMLAQVREWNSDKFAAPPTEFRQGHVKPRQARRQGDHEDRRRLHHPAAQQGARSRRRPSTRASSTSAAASTARSSTASTPRRASSSGAWTSTTTARPPPSCDDDVIVFNTESCTIFALDAKTGKHLWSLLARRPADQHADHRQRHGVHVVPGRGAAAGSGDQTKNNASRIRSKRSRRRTRSRKPRGREGRRRPARTCWRPST